MNYFDKLEKLTDGLNRIEIKIDKVNTGKLETTPTDLSKLSTIVKIKLLKRLNMLNRLKQLMKLKLVNLLKK